MTSYTIKRGDTLEKIAMKTLGNAITDDLILLHNQNIGALFNRKDLYSGAVIEIPFYHEFETILQKS